MTYNEAVDKQRLRELHGQALGWEIRYDLLRERLAGIENAEVAAVLAEFGALPPIPFEPGLSRDTAPASRDAGDFLRQC